MGAKFDPLLGQLRTTDAGGGTTYTAGSGLTLTANAFSLTSPVTVSNGGTGSTTQNFVDLTSAQTKSGSLTLSSQLNTSNISPSTNLSSTLGDFTHYYLGAYIQTMNFSSSAAIQANGSGILGTNADFWGSKGFKFGAGAGTGTDPFAGAIAGLKAYVDAPLFMLQGFSTMTSSLQEWKNPTGTSLIKITGDAATLAPVTNNGASLGSSSLYFSNLYSTIHNFNSTASMTGATAGVIAVTGKLQATAFQLGTTATAGYVLTADASGNATWQVGSGYITSLTTTGTSGAATLTSGVLNIPNYSAGSGGIGRSIVNTAVSITAGATASTDYIYLVTGTSNITLPTAVGNSNRYTVTNTGVATVTVGTTSSQTINGSLTVTLSPGTSLDFISNSTNWFVI